MYIGEYFRKKYNKYSAFIWYLLGIMILVILASKRSIEVGSDTGLYRSFFYDALNSKFTDYYFWVHHINEVEIGYTLFNYAVSRFTSNVIIFQGCCAFLIEFNIFLALFKLKDKVNIATGWLVFAFLFYPTTLNITRQCIALSLVFLGYSFTYEKRYLKGIIITIIAILFHKTAIIALFLMEMGFTLINSNKKNIRKLIIIYSLITMIFPYFMYLLEIRGLFNFKYSNYFSSGSSLSIIYAFLMRLPFDIFILYLWIKNKNNIKANNIWFMFLVLQDTLVLPLQQMSAILGRLMLYFGVSKIFVYPLICKKIANNKNKYILYNCLLIIYAAIIFYLQVIVANNNQVYPYTSFS